jgi:hypothetical protein
VLGGARNGAKVVKGTGMGWGLRVFEFAFIKMSDIELYVSQRFLHLQSLLNRYIYITKKKNSVALVRKRTIPTERPPLVGDVSANLCG